MAPSLTEEVIDDAETVTDPAERDHDCPLCDHAADTPTDVYSHLMVRHRKSAVSRALIETTTVRSLDGG